LITAVAGAIVVVGFFDSDEYQTLLWAIIFKLDAVGQVTLMLLLIGAVPAGIIGWLLLRWLGSLYRARRISDQSIMIDAVWLMFSLLQSPGYESMNLEKTGAIAPPTVAIINTKTSGPTALIGRARKASARSVPIPFV
jgi:hypothetical protein